jgi:Mg-chelatase subunit ChlD
MSVNRNTASLFWIGALSLSIGCGSQQPDPNTVPTTEPTTTSKVAPATERVEHAAAVESEDMREVDLGYTLSEDGMGAGRPTSAGRAMSAGYSATMGASVEASKIARGRAAEVKAGAHDDNEEYPLWLDFMDDVRHGVHGVLDTDYSDRFIVRITDTLGTPLINEAYVLIDESGHRVGHGRTLASGESVVYPNALDGQRSDTEQIRVTVPGGSSQTVRIGVNGVAELVLTRARTAQSSIPVDIAFIVDATGSMSDEIQQLRSVLFSIHTRLRNASEVADIRFGLVAYRDRGDREPLRVIPFTSDVDSIEQALYSLRADGGGDYAEDMQVGLQAALKNLDWRPDGIRAGFIIADAPPHTDYNQQEDYLWATQYANRNAIRLHTIGASGLSQDGEYIFRQIAATTYGQFIFLSYGETGESAGVGSPSDPGKVSHHTGSNWSSRRLDDIVVELIRRDLAYQTDIPILASDNPLPAEQEEHLTSRIRSLWTQITRQLAEVGRDSVDAVLLPFVVASEDSSLATYLRDISLETLISDRTVSIVERDHLEELLAEHALVLSGLVSPVDACEIGNLLESQLVLATRLYRLGTDRVMHIRAIDVETSKIVAAARVRV